MPCVHTAINCPRGAPDLSVVVDDKPHVFLMLSEVSNSIENDRVYKTAHTSFSIYS